MMAKQKKPQRMTIDPSQKSLSGMDAISRAAGRKRSRDAKAKRKALAARGTPESRARDERSAQRRLMLSSLGGADSDLRQYLRVIPAGAVLVGVLWGANEIPAIARVTRHGWGEAALIASSLTLMAVTLALSSLVLSRWRLRRLYGVGRGFDVEHYLAILGQARSRVTVRVLLRCMMPWQQEQRKTTIDAIATWDQHVTAHWLDGQVLELRTGELFTMAETVGDTESNIGADHKFFTNRPIHDAFMGIVHHVLPKIHAANPVVGIEVAADGEVYPYDTDPEQKNRFW